MDLKVKKLIKFKIFLLCLAASNSCVFGAKKYFRKEELGEASKLSEKVVYNSIERIPEIYNRLQYLENQIENMIERDQIQNKKISDLSRKIDSFESILERHRHFTEPNDAKRDEAMNIPNSSDAEHRNKITKDVEEKQVSRFTEDKLEMESRSRDYTHYPRSPKLLKRNRRAVGGVAFSAYLTRTYSHMMPGQPIKFDHVLINDGQSYNSYTGAFTVPLTGTYLFTFHIDSRENTFVRLVVNGVNENDVVANPHNNAASGKSESMGGNTAIVHVQRGQAVLVETYETNDSEVASSDKFRFCSFSGVLLY